MNPFSPGRLWVVALVAASAAPAAVAQPASLQVTDYQLPAPPASGMIRIALIVPVPPEQVSMVQVACSNSTITSTSFGASHHPTMVPLQDNAHWELEIRAAAPVTFSEGVAIHLMAMVAYSDVGGTTRHELTGDVTLIPDATPPAQNNTLQVVAGSETPTSIRVSWTEPGEPVAECFLYYAPHAPVFNPVTATRITAAATGAGHNVDVTDLAPGTDYDFSVSFVDAAPHSNESALSTIVTGTTGAVIIPPSPGDDPESSSGGGGCSGGAASGALPLLPAIGLLVLSLRTLQP